MLRDSVVAVAVMRTHPQTIPLAIITMRKSTNGFPFLSYMSMGLRLAVLWAAEPPLIKKMVCFRQRPSQNH